MVVFREFDKIAIFNSPHLEFIASTNEAKETAIITKNTVTIVKANRKVLRQARNFLFETQVIEISKFSAAEILCKAIDLNLNQLMVLLKNDEFFNFLTNYESIGDLNLLSYGIDEYPVEVKWFNRHRLLLLTNTGNLQLLERTQTSNWFLVRNLADFLFELLERLKEWKSMSDLKKYSVFQSHIRQYLFTTMCCFENLIFVANHENKILVIEWSTNGANNLNRLQTINPDENSRISCMECIVDKRDKIYLVIGYTNGKLLANKIDRKTFAIESKSIVCIADADLIIIKKIHQLTETGRFAVVRHTDIQIWQTCTKTNELEQLQEFAQDSISGLIELDCNRFILCTKQRDFRLLDAKQLRLTPVEFKSQIHSRILPNGMFNVSTIGSIVAVTTSHPNPSMNINSFFDGNSSIWLFSAETGTVCDPFDLIRKAIDSESLIDFDTISELLEFTRVSIWKNPEVLSNYFERVKKLKNFTDLELSLLYRCHEWQHNIERNPRMRLEIVNSLLARRAFQLLQKTILKPPDTSLIPLIQSICYDFLGFYVTAETSYNRKYQSNKFLTEIENLLRTIRDPEIDQKPSYENRPVCLECGSQFVYGLYCEQLHVASFCCLSLLPILVSSLTVRCPCCDSLVHDDFYELFITGPVDEPASRLFANCCFCKMTVQFY